MLQLSEYQRAHCKAAYYTIISQYATESRAFAAYYPVLSNVPIKVDEAGEISIPSDLKVLTLTDSFSDTRDFVCTECIDTDKHIMTLKTDDLCLKETGELGSAIDELALEVEVNLQTGEIRPMMRWKGGRHYVGEIVTADEAKMYYATLYRLHGTRGKTRAADGSMAPVAEWSQAEIGLSFITRFKDYPQFSLTSVSAGDYALYAQVVVEDDEGNHHGSELVSLCGGNKAASVQELEVATEYGRLQYTLADDHATLAKYEGEDTVVALPNEVSGRPLTAIGAFAFQNNQYVQELVLPDSMREIGDSALRNTHLKRVTLPKDLEKLGGYVFAGNKGLYEFVQNEDGPHFCVRDGVLYTTDSSTLLAYPSAKGSEFTIPDGVTRVGYAAFAGTDISKITFPETLRQIDACAFESCFQLQIPQLPDGLEYIGGAAFSSQAIGYVSEAETNKDNAGSIRIGPHVSYIGYDVFNLWPLTSIGVDSANKWYSTKDGFLLDADGMLIEAPQGILDSNVMLVVPDGVTALGPGVFSMLDSADDQSELISIYLPASLMAIMDDALPTRVEASDMSNEGTQTYNIHIFAPSGSWAERFAREHGIEFDIADTPDASRWHEVIVDDHKATLTFRCFPDHAVLVGIKAEDAGHVAIPEMVEDVPVTRIGASERDVASGTVVTLVLPASIERVDGTLLSKVEGLRKFEVDERNTHYSVKDASLCSADGEMLVSYPRERGGTYVVPDGITEVGPRAFYGSEITAVTLPEGVSSIAEGAFESCGSLESISFPSTLEYIGARAFSGVKLKSLNLNEGLTYIAKDAFRNARINGPIMIPDSVVSIGDDAFSSSSYGQDSLSLQKVVIGSGLKEIGSSIFGSSGAAKFSSFEVSQKNGHFRSDGPFLLSKDGRILYQCAATTEQSLQIPDGVEEIQYSALSALTEATREVYLPDSLLRMSSYIFDNDAKKRIVLHCHSGTEAALLAESGEYTWVED